MAYDIKILRDNINSQFEFLRNDVSLATIPFSYPWAETEVVLDSDFSVWMEATSMSLAYLGNPSSGIQDFKIDISSFCDVPLGDSCGFIVCDSTWATNFFFVIKNQFGTFSSLTENGMLFDSELVTATGLTYVPVSVPVDSGVSLVLRSQKGSPLTHNQLDENFIFLNSKIENFDLNIQDFYQSLNDFTVFKNLAPFSLNRLSLPEDKIKLFELDMPVYVGLDYNSRTVAYFDLFLHIYNSSGNPAFEQFRVFRNVPITYTYDEANDILTFVDVSNDISFNIGFVYDKTSNKMICFLPVGSPTWDALAKCTFSVCSAYDISFYETFDFVATVS